MVICGVVGLPAFECCLLCFCDATERPDFILHGEFASNMLTRLKFIQSSRGRMVCARWVIRFANNGKELPSIS